MPWQSINSASARARHGHLFLYMRPGRSPVPSAAGAHRVLVLQLHTTAEQLGTAGGGTLLTRRC